MYTNPLKTLYVSECSVSKAWCLTVYHYFFLVLLKYLRERNHAISSELIEVICAPSP